MPSDARFCGFDGTELSLDALSNASASTSSKSPNAQFAKACPICERKYPAKAFFCATDGNELKLFSQENNGDSIFSSSVSLVDVGQKPASSLITLKDLNEKLVGKLLAEQYLLESIISQNESSTVYFAVDETEKRNVTVRIIHDQVFANSEIQENFEKRCRLMNDLNYDNIVRLYQFGSIGPHEPYLVAEYLKGLTLSEKLTNQGLPPLKVIGAIIIQLCKGLEEAHRIGLVHQDLKPANVTVQEDSEQVGWVKINNFALSNYISELFVLASGKKLRGTPEYMAPEQFNFNSDSTDVRSDLYSLGVMVYEMLTGTLPFTGVNSDALANKHINETAPPLNVLRLNIDSESPFAILVGKALEKDPQKRFQTATEFRLAVEKALT